MRPPRRGTTLAALVAGLWAALLCAGCEPSSLAPFSKMKGPGDYLTESYDGTWSGSTPLGGTVSFQVGSSRLVGFDLTTGGTCSRVFPGDDEFVLAGNTVTLDLRFDSGGSALIEGTFTSDTTMSGTYSFLNLPPTVGETCPTSGSGTFVANRTY